MKKFKDVDPTIAQCNLTIEVFKDTNHPQPMNKREFFTTLHLEENGISLLKDVVQKFQQGSFTTQLTYC